MNKNFIAGVTAGCVIGMIDHICNKSVNKKEKEHTELCTNVSDELIKQRAERDAIIADWDKRIAEAHYKNEQFIEKCKKEYGIK